MDELLREALLGREKEGLVGGKEGLMGRLEAGERLEKGCERFWEFKRGNREGVLRFVPSTNLPLWILKTDAVHRRAGMDLHH